MTFLDWAIVAFTLALALWGYRQGLIVGALTLAGFAVGAFTGSRVGPMLMGQGPDSAYAPLCGALGALLVGALAAVAFESFALGVRQRLIRRRRGFLHSADGAGGAALIASVALGLAWVFGAVALHAPATAELRADVQGSLILSNLNRMMPPSGPVLGALNRVDPAPAIGGPPPPATPPDPALAFDPDVDGAGDSVVRVLGTACGLGVEGSGWAVRPDLVVTNAHVIAGSDDTTVTTREGIEQEATPVYLEPRDDLALLRVEDELDPLPLVAETRSGTSGAVLGYPENGPYSLAPARLGETRSVISEDAYGNGPLERSIASLRGEVRSGNSGGPLVDGAGRVLGTVFAATTSGPKGGFAIPNEAVYRALDGATGEIGTGPCSR